MERGASTTWLHAVAASLAAAATVSCGTGVHGAEGWFYVEKEMDERGGVLSLREGTLTVDRNALSTSTAEIELRRQDQHEKQAGAVGPVFTVVTPHPDTFTLAPRLSIAVRPETAGNAQYVLGYLVEETKQTYPQWVPDSTLPRPQCAEGVVCGLVQREDFTNPGGIPDKPRTAVPLAVVKTCPNGLDDCSSGQECSSGCCQQCVTGGPCKP